MKNWKGDSKSAFRILGASNHVSEEREEMDYYATDPIAIKLLLDEENFENVLEPSCGEGHLSKELIKNGVKVTSRDIVDRGFGTVADFLCITNQEWHGDIITNPPYRWAKEFVEKSLNIVSEGNKVAMFLKLTFMEGKGRKHLFQTNPPKTIYVSSSRIKCFKNGLDNNKNSAIAYAWYVWEKGFKGSTTIKWIN